MQKVQSPMDSKCLYFSWPREVTTIQTWVWQKFGTKFSDHYLDNSSGQEKKDPAVMCWAQDPGDLIQLGKTVPQTARHQSPWCPKEGMKENTGIPHRCFNTYGQLMTRQKCQVKFLVGDWQKGVINYEEP